MVTHPLVGTWRLVSFDATDPDGRVSYPLGADAAGYYIFEESGYAAVTIMSRDRPAYSSDDIFGGTVEEMAAAAAGYLSYSGRYEIRGDKVAIRIEVGIVPNRIDTEQVRSFKVEGDTLVLFARTVVKGSMKDSRLVWERVPPRH